MSNEKTKSKHDLEERTAVFGERVIALCKAVPYDHVSKPLVSQLVRAGTSIGANYMEANGASSKKDFRNKIYLCKKESQETKHWLRMIAHCVPAKQKELRLLWKEAQELTLIFGRIIATLNAS